MILLYGGDSTDAELDLFRYRMFQRKVAVASVAVQPEDIPPTSAAVKFHSRRTYHQVSIFLTYIYCDIFKYKQILCWPNIHYIFIMIQVQNWLGNDKIDAVQWGWELRDIMLVPTLTDLPPAPQDLLKIIKCSCMGSCDTLRCTCRKNGIDCSVSCKNCKGISCKNSKIIEEDDSDVEE